MASLTASVDEVSAAQERKSAALNDLVTKAITKRHKDAIVNIEGFAPTDYISTGLPGVDHIIGAPGIPCGRLTTIVGKYASGKSTLGYSIMAQAQKREAIVLLIETEDAVDHARLQILGVDANRLLIANPASVEMAIDNMLDAIAALREANPDVLMLVVWDSVAATPVEGEIDEDTEKIAVAGHARVISRGLRKLIPAIHKHRTALVFINQWREKVGGPAFANNKVMLANAPIGFASSLMLEVVQVAKLKEKPGADIRPHGVELEVAVIKNKLAAPFGEASVHLLFDTGFDIGQSWLDLGLAQGVVKKAGSYITLPGYAEKMQRERAKQTLLEDAELQELIRRGD